MSQCDPSGGGRWPDTRPCGAHGSCVANALWGAGLAQSVAQSVCACDSGWSSAGDFVFQPIDYCHITRTALMPMWAVALLAVIVVTSVYVRVVKAYAIILREQEARKKRALDDTSEKHGPAAALGLWKVIKSKLALAFIFLFNNPTRTCLFTISLCLLGFGILSLTKLIEFARRFGGAQAQGGVSFEAADEMIIGLHVFPTVLYCISSMAFLVSGSFSSLIWCASAQAFYPRAEGSALRLHTQKELGIASIIHVCCYVLPGVAVALGARLSSLDARPSLSGGALSPYEIVVALHFQLKAFVPLATYIVDVRLARLVINNLKKHDVAMHAKTKPGAASAAAAGGAIEPSKQSRGAPSSGKGIVAGSVVAAPASAALPEPNDVSRLGRASISLSAAPLDRLPSTNPLLTAANSLPLPAGDATGSTGPGSAGLTHVRRPSLPLGPKTLLKRPIKKQLRRRNNSADSPITAGQTLKIRMEAVAAAPGPSSRAANADAASDLEDLTSRPLQPATQSARLPPPHTKYAVVSDARAASPVAHLSSGPVITPLRPIPHRPPTVISPTNRSTMRASTVQLALAEAPMRVTPSPVRFHTTENDTDVPIHSRQPSLDHRTGSGVWAAPSGTPATKAALAASAADRRKSLALAQSAMPRRTTLNLPSTGGNSSNVVVHMSSVGGNSSMRRGTVTTAVSSMAHSRAASVNLGQTGTMVGAGSSVATAVATAAQKSQAEMAEEQRSKLLEFCKRLAKHNRTTRTIAAVWLVVNTLFGWVPLLRSFTSYILPIQVLATVLAIFTLLRTLSPKSNKSAGKADTGSAETTAVAATGGATTKEKSTNSAKQTAATTIADGSRRQLQQQQRLSAGAVSPSPTPTHHSSTAAAPAGSPSPALPLATTLPAVTAAVPSAVELMQLQPVTPSQSETHTPREAAPMAAVTAAVCSPLRLDRSASAAGSPENPSPALPGRVPPSGSPVLSSIPASLRKQMSAEEEAPRTPSRRSVHMSQRRLAHLENMTP